MGFRIIIAGESQCAAYAETCLLADYLSRNLPNFCYHCIEVPVMDWKTWLCKVNVKNKWHHMESPIVWKELLMKGSKAQYIGGASDFLDYCYSYYNFDTLFSSEKYDGLLNNVLQFKRKLHIEENLHILDADKRPTLDAPPQKKFVVTISGAGHLLAMHLISGLVDHAIMASDNIIHKIYLYDQSCTPSFMNYIEKECSYVQTDNPGRDINKSKPMGAWLRQNRNKMKELALMINASGSRKMYIIFPNLGPACYNATILRNSVNINKNNIVVATSDVGVEILPVVAKVAQVPMRNIFCPPVWGFIGINQLVDIQTTIHVYNSFNPYKRYARVRHSSLNIGSITPETRLLDYLMHFDETLWIKVAEMKEKFGHGQARLSKAIAVISLVNLWLLNPSPDHIVSLGICCDGSFGLHFDGIFSQPARFVDGRWKPATDFLMPKDRQMKLPYLIDMAKLVMKMQPNDLPEIQQYYPCICKKKNYKIKEK
ncbi:hypothetical protein HF086_016600 [Spodoptera exigua]|uniref:Malate dehydrogenase 1B n=1 Tax=Spodoptera exigua TaxID=7107 RepID=A0A922MCS8_SPOEX|nr:hypothetical protein HF086_016600 [Spodoptera exigua]